jgi:hypothetical protein
LIADNVIPFISCSCSLTLIADNIIHFISCPFSLTLIADSGQCLYFVSRLSYIDIGQRLYLFLLHWQRTAPLSFSLTLAAPFILWPYSLTLTIANVSSFYILPSAKLPHTNNR